MRFRGAASRGRRRRALQPAARRPSPEGARRWRVGACGRRRVRGQARVDHCSRMTEETAAPLWEVFIRSKRGLSHNHVGSLHAPDAEMALRNARDVYTRRMEGVSIWVVPSAVITASSPEEKDSFFDPAADKPYRHPTFYSIPKEVQQL